MSPRLRRAPVLCVPHTFPVLIGDEGVEKAFAIAQYPSKRLITPTGRLVSLPGDDWQETVRAHLFGHEASRPARP